jgi:hypothetical protein
MKVTLMLQGFIQLLGITAGVIGRQGMLLFPRYLIPPLVYLEVRVSSSLISLYDYEIN